MRKPHCTEQALLKRRDVIKGGAVVLASAFFPFSIEILNAGSAVAAPPAPSGTGEERILWNSCNVNCGSRCALRVHVKDGVITRVETDNTGDDRYGMQQLRACPRGRSMRQRIYAEQRIPYPLRRVGNRGEGKFERISWEEAFKEIGQRLRGTIDTYGNEAVYLNYGTGALGSTMGKSWPPAATPVARLMNLVGGYLNHYSDYSTCQITVGMPYLYGGSWVDGNSLSDMENSELAVFFGNNPSETRMSGCKAKTLQHARFTRNTRVIIIDPRYTDSMVSVGDEWIPIRPGTDAALSAALAYVMITEDLIDKPFLAKYTIGYDEESLPKGAPAGSSYKSYILGQGPDKTPKTPAWASRITGIPPARIEKLAREIAGARPCFICQGWGPQRTTNGENISRAIGMLAVLTGNVGIKGGNTGARENAGYKLPMATFPTLENPVKTELSCFNWYQAIDDYKQMTATTAGIRGRERLIAPIKFIWNYAGNCLTNQHGGINQMHPILLDDKKCETIVVIDTTLTPSARYADFLLPSCLNLEEHDWTSDGDSNIAYVIFDNKCIEPLGEAKSIYDICAGVANELGVKEAFTEGRTQYPNGWRNCTRSPARPSPNCRPRWRKPTRWACTKGTSPKTISPIKHSGTIPRPIPCPRRRAKSRSIRRASPSWRKHGPCCPVRPSPRCPSTSPTPKARSARNARSGRCSSSGTTTSSARTRPTGTAGGCRKSRRKSSGSTPSTRKPAASNSGIV